MIPARLTRTLVALVLVYEAHGRADVRAVASQAGRPTMTVHRHLVTLRRLGLCTWEDHREATLRPTVQRVPFRPERVEVDP